MDTKKFDFVEAIKYAFTTTSNNIDLYIKSLIIFGLVFIATAIVNTFILFLTFFKANPTSIIGHIIPVFLMYLILYIFMMGIMPGYYKMLLQLHDTGKAEWKEMFSLYSLAPQYLLGLILYFIIIAIGLGLLILPGIYLAIRFAFWQYNFVEQQKGIIDAFKQSWEMTRDQWWAILPLVLISMLLHSNALLFLLTMFLVDLMLIYAYRSLTNQPVTPTLPR